MKVYSGSEIRNVAVVGHNDTGKTTLVSQLLFNAGAATRMGRVEDGTTVTDFDPDEIERKHSISSGSKSVTVVPSSTRPMRVAAPALNSSCDTSVVLPVSLCPTTATLRISEPE